MEPKVDQRHMEAAKDVFLLELGRPDAYERIAKLLSSHFPIPPSGWEEKAANGIWRRANRRQAPHSEILSIIKKAHNGEL